MKISILFIISILSFSSSCQNSENSTSSFVDLRKEINLIGAVKSIKNRTYEIEGQKSFEFLKGKKYWYPQIHRPSISYLSNYDNYDVTVSSRGGLLNFIGFDYDGKEVFNVNCIVDNFENLLEFTTKSDNKTTKGIAEIGQNGKVKMTKIYNSKNELESYIKIEYNKSRKPILIQYFDNNDVFKKKHIYQYINGKTIIAKYDEDDELVYSSIYNDRNQKIEGAFMKEKTNIEYNSEGAVVKVEVSGNEVLNYKYTNKVDNKLNIISQIYVTSNEQMEITCKYKYDNHGNWIERIESAFDEPICVTKRDIKYY